MAIDFDPGDYVRLRNGKEPQRVVQAELRSRGQYLRTEYLRYRTPYTPYGGADPVQPKWRPASDYVRFSIEEYRARGGTGNYTQFDAQIERDVNRKKETKTVSKLYQTKDGKFGTYLATNSKGELVLEMKGTGEAQAFAEADLEIVRPYTVKVLSLGDAGGFKHYRAKAGIVKPGDLLVLASGAISKVVEVDTKQEGASVLKASRLVTEAIEEVAGE